MLLVPEGLSTAQIHERLGLVHAETFGAAAYHYPDGPQYEHFINTSDPVPRLAGLGKSTRRDRNAGAGAEVHRFRDNKASRGDLFGSHDFDLYLEHRERIQQEVEQLRGEIAALMQAAVKVSSEVLTQAQDEVVISGERNLLAVSDFSSDMGQLRRAFELFEQKTQLMRLLDVSSRAEGVRIYIGGESQVVPFEELSVVTAPYEVDGRVVGTLGVIGPTRMAYDRMIQIVDITSRLVGNVLSVK